MVAADAVPKLNAAGLSVFVSVVAVPDPEAEDAAAAPNENPPLEADDFAASFCSVLDPNKPPPDPLLLLSPPNEKPPLFASPAFSLPEPEPEPDPDPDANPKPFVADVDVFSAAVPKENPAELVAAGCLLSVEDAFAEDAPKRDPPANGDGAAADFESFPPLLRLPKSPPLGAAEVEEEPKRPPVLEVVVAAAAGVVDVDDVDDPKRFDAGAGVAAFEDAPKEKEEEGAEGGFEEPKREEAGWVEAGLVVALELGADPNIFRVWAF